MSMRPNTSVMDALTTSASNKSTKMSNGERFFPLLLLAIFVVVDLLALVAGTHAYDSLTTMQNKSDAHILTAGPLASNVRANDARGAMRRKKNGPEGEALVLVESDEYGTYETRIYLYKGNIVQEYALADTPYAPDKATVLAKSSTFSFEYRNGLLSLHTDAGTTKIALRNMQGGE